MERPQNAEQTPQHTYHDKKYRKNNKSDYS